MTDIFDQITTLVNEMSLSDCKILCCGLWRKIRMSEVRYI